MKTHDDSGKRLTHTFRFAGFKSVTDRNGNWKQYRTCECGAVKASPLHRGQS